MIKNVSMRDKGESDLKKEREREREREMVYKLFTIN